MRKMNIGKQFKNNLIIGFVLIAAGTLTGCNKVEVTNSTINLELGENLSSDVRDYMTSNSEDAFADMTLDISGVDQSTPGTYTATVDHKGNIYEIEVVITDTTAPEIACVDYLITKSGTITADQVVTELSDAGSAWVGFVTEKISELEEADLSCITSEKAVAVTDAEYVEADLAGEITLTEEGCYQITAVAEDASGNTAAVSFYVYVDDTAPVLEQTATEVTVDASTIVLDDIESDDIDEIVEMLHELPEFKSMEFVDATDNLDQDKVIFTEYGQTDFDVTRENPVETLKYTCTASDQAGNESETAEYEVKVTYEDLDAAALAKKAGLETASNTGSKKGSGSGNSTTTAAANSNQTSQYSGDPDVPIDGMTMAEYENWLLSLTNEQSSYYAFYVEKGKDKLYYDRNTGLVGKKDGSTNNVVASGSSSNTTGTQATTQSGYYDRQRAQDIFNLINADRTNNGINALVWSDTMLAVADQRAIEIIDNFSFTRPDGSNVTSLGYGENICDGASVSAQKDYESLDKTNVLNSEFNYCAISVYYDSNGKQHMSVLVSR